MLEKYTFSFLGMFVAMDIIGILPLYMGMTQGLEKPRRERILKLSIYVAAIVALLFVFVGRSIFKVIGISIYDFKVGGGIVLLVMAILDLVQRRSADEVSKSTGVVPLAVPLITGPALITTIMLQVGLYGNLVVLLALASNFLVAWVALHKSAFITKVIGVEGTDIVSKIAALLMTAIAFSMIRTGLFEAIRAGQ